MNVIRNTTFQAVVWKNSSESFDEIVTTFPETKCALHESSSSVAVYSRQKADELIATLSTGDVLLRSNRDGSIFRVNKYEFINNYVAIPDVNQTPKANDSEEDGVPNETAQFEEATTTP